MEIKEDKSIESIGEKNPPSEKQKKEVLKNLAPAVSAFKQEFDKEENLEKKLKMTLDFMRESISQIGAAPRFRDFWEAKHLALSVFKESLNPLARSTFWKEYTELITEAGKLKEILDEQASFAIEQIELAIKAIDRDFADYDRHVSSAPDMDFPKKCESLENKKTFYNSLQKEIHFLNTLASQLHALRKEVIRTEMRIRHKNKLLEHISSLGDKILPKRKALIKEISDAFVSDIEIFSNRYFSIENQKIAPDVKVPYYALREEIKALQGIAKLISLNSFAFKETRKILSACWEILKEEEKIAKKEFADKKLVFKENFQKITEQLDAFEKHIKEEQLPFETIDRAVSEIQASMRSLDLGREEIKILRDRLQDIKKYAFTKVKEKEKAYLEKEQLKEKDRKDKVANLISRLSNSIDQIDDLPINDLLAFKEGFPGEVELLSLREPEEVQIMQLMQQLDLAIFEKKEKEILELKDEELKFSELEQIEESLESLRSEAKERLEKYRGEMSRSGLDFEAAITYREILDIQKSLLDHIDMALTRIDEHLAELGD